MQGGDARMIDEVVNSNGCPALTSDRWHLVHARWSAQLAADAPFERTIVSEHRTEHAGQLAAKEFAADMRKRGDPRAGETRDQLFLRRPGSVTRKFGPRIRARLR